jgi:peptide/nickel transport system permease protein
MNLRALNKWLSVPGSLLLSLLFIAWVAFFIQNRNSQLADEADFSGVTALPMHQYPWEDRQRIIRNGKKKDLDLPLFYFSLRPRSYPAEYHKILPLRERVAARSLLEEGVPGDHILSLRNEVSRIAASVPQKKANRYLKILEIDNRVDLCSELKEVESPPTTLQSITADLCREHTASYWPTFYWHGSNNRWHHQWISFFTGQWGHSRVDGQSVNKKISAALPYTLIINGASLFLLFFTAIPMGSWWALRPNALAVKISRQLAYLFYVAPLFWLAALAIAFLTQPQGIFPLPAGAGSDFEIMHFALPLLCIWISGFGYLARLFEDTLRAEWNKPYIKFSRHRGLKTKKVLLHYAMPNALLPMITLIGAALPALISGSLVIEVLFNIPGMGRLIWWSLNAQDWPVVIITILLIGLFAWLGRWGADQLSLYLDPRIQWSEK